MQALGLRGASYVRRSLGATAARALSASPGLRAMDKFDMEREVQGKSYIPDPIRNKALMLNDSPFRELDKWLFGASAFQAMAAGMELGLYDMLHTKGPMSKTDIMKELKLESRAADILLMCLVSMDTMTLQNGVYDNCYSIKTMMEDDTWQCFKDITGFEKYVVYMGLFDLTESLAQNKNVGLQRVPGKGKNLYHRFHENPHMEKKFYEYMNSFTRITNGYLVDNVDWKSVTKVIDMGGGTGINAITLCKHYPHLKCVVVDIEESSKICKENVKLAGLSDRIEVMAGDFFNLDLPECDTVLFSHQSVIWTEDENVRLYKRAKEVLPQGGRCVVFQSMADDDGTGPLMAALDSCYFAAIPEEGGQIYTFGQVAGWLKEAGFKETKTTKCHGWTPHGVVQGFV